MCIFPITFTGTGRWFRPATFLMLLVAVLASCGQAPKTDPMQDLSASELLGNPDYPAISYGGYRGVSRSEQPTLAQLKEDMRILHAIGIRFLRTYNVQLPHASNVVKAISELKQADPSFEMYVMLGAWTIGRALGPFPNHAVQDFEATKKFSVRWLLLSNSGHCQGDCRGERRWCIGRRPTWRPR